MTPLRPPGFPRRGGRLFAVALALVVATAGCARSEPADPAKARRDRVEARLRSTFSLTQVRCILGEVDTSVLRTLDRKEALTPDSAELATYSAAVRKCVTGGPTVSGPNAGPTTSTG
ncbi:MAG: hypothetical protein ACR2MB_06145 [Acidimicrobiales bacterium]